MYAIIATDGKQIKVHEGEELQMDYREVESGEKLTFDKVLAAGGEGGLKFGRPTLDCATVTAEVVGVVAGPEDLRPEKFRRRRGNQCRRTGHRRELYTKVKITQISVP